jgi:hypothetical protein
MPGPAGTSYTLGKLMWTVVERRGGAANGTRCRVGRMVWAVTWWAARSANLVRSFDDRT